MMHDNPGMEGWGVSLSATFGVIKVICARFVLFFGFGPLLIFHSISGFPDVKITFMCTEKKVCFVRIIQLSTLEYS